jgi:hypothetical protein
LFYVFLLIVGLLSLGLYVLFILNLVPGAKEERLGVLEPLPPDTGTWKAETESAEARAAEQEGLVREVRHYFYATEGRLVLQVRYKQPDTGEVVRADAEQPVKRRRIRK